MRTSQIKEELVDGGFTGLCVPGVCGCDLEDLCPCGETPKIGIGPDSCEPGYKHFDPRKGHDGEWAIFLGKEVPTVEQWEATIEY